MGQERVPGQLPVAWHALYTRHQHEKSAARILSDKGFETFLPLHADIRRWRDRRKKLELPLFPCYLFLRGGLERQFEVLGTPGVCWFVESGDRVAEIPENELEAILRIVNERLPVESHPFLKSGDLVRVRQGPLDGVEGILVRKKDHGSRLVVAVEMLQRAVAVEVDASWVERIAQEPKGAPMSMHSTGVPRKFLRVGHC